MVFVGSGLMSQYCAFHSSPYSAVLDFWGGTCPVLRTRRIGPAACCSVGSSAIASPGASLHWAVEDGVDEDVNRHKPYPRRHWPRPAGKG
jgi:hypothetical protein